MIWYLFGLVDRIPVDEFSKHLNNSKENFSKPV